MEGNLNYTHNVFPTISTKSPKTSFFQAKFFPFRMTTIASIDMTCYHKMAGKLFKKDELGERLNNKKGALPSDTERKK